MFGLERTVRSQSVESYLNNHLLTHCLVLLALILGMLLSGLLQNYLQSKENGGDGMVTAEQWVGGALAAVSLWMHSKFR